MAVNPESGRFPAIGQLFAPQHLGTLLTAAAIIALTVGAWLWSQTPDYRVLYTNVSDRDGGDIVAALQQMNVPYRFAEGGGAILVPATHVHEARLRLASQGLPKGSLVGFELMENPKLGASQFLEQVNYQRALEGELARTIQSLSAVAGARVHLALTKPSVFVREQQKPSASVLLNLNAGRTLDAAQVSAIVHLVSASVPELPVKNVTLIDQNGNLLTAEPSGQNANALDATQLKYQHELETTYAHRIESILTPLTGADNVRAQVTADVDFSQTERAEEIYKPNQSPTDAVVRSQQTSESSSATATAAGGVPGALSNQPAAPATAPITAPGAPAPAAQTTAGSSAAASSAPLNTRKDATINYEVDKTIRHVRQPVGGIRHLSAAVVVNYRRDVAADGKVTNTPLSPEEMTKITDLVKEAVGYNQQRGDSLNVVNSPFTTVEREAVPETPLWKQPGTIALAKEIGKHLLIAAVVLYLVLGVLLPLLRTLLQRAAAQPQQLQPGPVQQQALSYQHHLETAKQLARQEPKVVANVVKNWVAGNE